MHLILKRKVVFSLELVGNVRQTLLIVHVRSVY